MMIAARATSLSLMALAIRVQWDQAAAAGRWAPLAASLETPRAPPWAAGLTRRAAALRVVRRRHAAAP